jgi:hypothetical protein
MGEVVEKRMKGGELEWRECRLKRTACIKTHIEVYAQRAEGCS